MYKDLMFSISDRLILLYCLRRLVFYLFIFCASQGHAVMVALVGLRLQ